MFDAGAEQSPIRSQKNIELPSLDEGVDKVVGAQEPSSKEAPEPAKAAEEQAKHEQVPAASAVQAPPKGAEIPASTSSPSLPTEAPARTASPAIGAAGSATPPPLPRRAAARRAVPPPPGAPSKKVEEAKKETAEATVSASSSEGTVVSDKEQKEVKAEGSKADPKPEETPTESNAKSPAPTGIQSSESSDDEFVDAVGANDSNTALERASSTSESARPAVPNIVTTATSEERVEAQVKAKEVKHEDEEGRALEEEVNSFAEKDLVDSPGTVVGSNENRHGPKVDGEEGEKREEDEDADDSPYAKEVFVGDATWEERTWKELAKLKEDMFWARVGGWR